ncbi:MAG: TonB-dependent siderophore receptor [Hydrococcus sp. RU_2_2]|nr:TonB-dependent siderophore receptor [Hydrococcus sp. RU_2_2]
MSFLLQLPCPSGRVKIRKIFPLETNLFVQQPTPAPHSPSLTRQEKQRGQIVVVTGVKLNPTETGIELILQTPTGEAELLQPNNVSSGNNFIVEIPNTQLQLPNSKPFRQANPIEGISEVTVTNIDANTIRVTVTGETAQPQVELFDSDQGLIFGFTPTQQEIVSIDRVQLNQTETGFEIILLTPTGTAQQLRVVNISEGNNFIAEIPNAQLKLPDGEPFRSENPIEGVSEVTVTNQNENTVRVIVVGEEKQPTVELFDSEEGLIFSAVGDAPSARGEEDIELVVTGEQDGYAVPNASVGTRTNTPIRDVPQSIQVVPRQVLEDQGSVTLTDALRNVSGVTTATGVTSSIRETFFPTIRGFSSGFDNFSVDGTSRTLAFGGRFGLNNVEQIEVLKGPASVLYGSGEPGGTVNVTTEQPQRDPAYEIEGVIGNFDFYNPSIDLTGPLNADRTILYRLNLAYENSGSFTDFSNLEVLEIYPVMSFQLGENTKLTLDVTYNTASQKAPPSGLPAEGTLFPSPFGEIPRSRFIGEPDFDELETSYVSAGYRLEHRFSDDWSLNNRFLAAFAEDMGRGVFGGRQDDGRTYNRTTSIFKETTQAYTLQTDLIGQVQTGIVRHDLLFGVELSWFRLSGEGFVPEGENVYPIDIFNPVYGADIPPISEFDIPDRDDYSETNAIGVYVQNLLSIGEQVKILLGGRLDWSETSTDDNIAATSSSDNSTDFSPRIGIVYQPIEPISLYGSWSRSTLPQTGLDREGNPFVPITGEQFEVGVRAELFDDRLIANLAAYQITRQNDRVDDPVDPENFQIQIGERRSQGIEFDLSGEPFPGLRLIATYAYTDSIITEDTTANEGNRALNVPLHSGSLWAVYEIQEGDLAGLGFGAGLFIVGERPGDLENSFDLPGYTRTDAVLYYRRDNWRVQLNVNNLFDVEYFESSAAREFLNYGAPFTIRGTVSVTF